ncbi:glycine--tRNA ligase subunit beta [Bacillus aquiflavi]|uniref:Glycine--tRNA ligase beta subunit n=2 Tax=Bacillus aquiflavi TaxID=2672567 RepID=A0A6B3VV69_9BACI|nr:glycine--tRNA ligase subunit beta [Bacillus aquiflavi]MBA4535862.1 glycine--tRNA ligase subunit beta [Bacillus aquiflavi]NEY80237.1 glycine--tRNA ligase subunit beta [Bacillus aquiflavi]
MNKQDLLIEIGLEELPARFVTNSMNQFSEKITKWLSEKKIIFGEVEAFSTPRRLAVLIKDVAEAQEDIQVEAKGPSKKITVDKSGNWSKAAVGFSRGQGMTVEDIYFKEINGVEYAFVNKFIKGQKTLQLLPDLKNVITSLHFPKTMRWANQDLRYIRPIKWIVALFGTDIIPFSITNVKTNRITFGHRFLGKETEITNCNEYASLLLKEFVVVDPAKRKEMIRSQIEQIQMKNDWVILIDEDLLEEVNNLVEYPTALFGKFDDSFLNLPEEVLITSMKEHQRYFPVKSPDGKLLPYFITVRNGDQNHIDIVAKGNEKVLRARLADADFFYKEDQQLEISTALKKLEKVVYHENIGTMIDKTNRVRKLTSWLANQLEFSKTELQLVDRAAEICKFDLVTNMVNEFPELQGFMGEKYALQKGENADVAKAINEHYMPRNADDHTPQTHIGATLAIADKLDTIVSFFAIGVTPTGSQDPYALRRQAAGIIDTLLNQKWEIEIEELVATSLHFVKEDGILQGDITQVESQIIHFFKLRIKHLLQDRGIRYDLIEAVIGGTIGSIPSLIKRSDILEKEKDSLDFKENIEALSRVLNISQKQEKSGEVDSSLFENNFELELHEKIEKVKISLNAVKSEHEYYQLLVSLKPEINQYFDHTMVMAEDKKIRNNRLNQLNELAQLIITFANVNKIIVK